MTPTPAPKGADIEQYRPGFEAWFDAEYPKNDEGRRLKYVHTGVMDLMMAAYVAGKREASTEPSSTSTSQGEPSGEDDFPISVSTYGSLEECEKEHARRAAAKSGAAPGDALDALRLDFLESCVMEHGGVDAERDYDPWMNSPTFGDLPTVTLFTVPSQHVTGVGLRGAIDEAIAASTSKRTP